jgi:hypothetical protein
MKKFLSIMMILCAMQVPAQDLLNYPLDTINGEEVYVYEVERSVGLYRIGVNFNVTQSEIIRLNPQLRERGLHYGETLYLPTGRPVVEGAAPVAVQPSTPTSEKEPIARPDRTEPVKVETVVEARETLEIVRDTTIETIVDTVLTDTIDTIRPRQVVELALMLPFESQQTKRSNNADKMMEFYQGALLALHDLQNDSILYRLRVYDTERSERRVNALCEGGELDSVRGVIGLVYPIQIERMAIWSTVHEVPILLPFSDNTDLSERPYLLQFNSTDRQEADSLCQWIKARGEDLHCVAVDVTETEMADVIRALRKQMDEHKIDFTALPLHDLMTDSAAYALDSTKENLIILHQERYQNARILMPHLIKLQEAGFRIRIVSQYSWRKELIRLPQVYTSLFSAENNRTAYDAQWATYFSPEHVSETPRYDLLGYDLMGALIAWINGDKEFHGLLTDIRWQQTENGGWQNGELKIEN